MNKTSPKKDRAQKYLDIAGVIFVVINAEQKVTLINKKGCEILGYPEEEILGKNWFDNFIPERIKAEVKAVFCRLISGELAPYEYYENPVLTKCGEERNIAWHNTVITDKLGNIIETLSSGEDITERKKAEKELQEAKEFLDNIFTTVPDGIMITDSKGYVVKINEGLKKMLGYPEEEIVGKHTAEIPAPQDEQYRGIGVKMVTELREKGFIKNFEACWLKKDGGLCPIELNITMLKDSEGNRMGAVSIIRDITERTRMEEEIRTLSLTDELTGLYNRRGFLTLAEQQLKVASRLQSRMLLIFVDLDGMKWINDNLGHSAGDQALIETASILRETFRKSDIVARIGGDEFVILALGADDTTSVVLLNRLQKMVHALNIQENRLFKLYISTGLAVYNPQFPSSTEELLALADQSMYKHKQGKKGFSA